MINQKWAIIAHLDVLTALNEGVAKCRLVLVDLEAGRYAGGLCVASRQWEKRTDVFSIPTDDLTVSVPVSPAEFGDGDVVDGPASRFPSAGEPIASTVATPIVEEPPTDPVEQAVPAGDVDSPAGAETFAERRARLLERAKALPQFKRQFRERQIHPADLDGIEALLDELENPPVIRELVEERMAVDLSHRTPVRRFSGDEGAEVDKRAADELMAMGKDLPAERQRHIHAVAAEASATVGNFSLKGRLSMRRYDITRALITWARIDWSDELIRACLVAATGDEAIHQPAIPLGTAVGMLDVNEATVFAELTARIANGSMAPDYSGPHPRLVAA